ncbi:MAG: alpha/beta hydrolase [Bacteroidota bacterium]
MNLVYRISGKGKTVLFLHGFCENKDLWLAFENRLSASYQVIVVDLPGFGESLDNTQYQSIDMMAREVFKALSLEQIHHCVVVGHSLGGYVAMALADLYPQLLSGLCLFHSTAYPDSDEKKHTRDKTATFIEKRGLEPFLETFVPSIFFADTRAALADRIKVYYERARQTPVATAVAVTKAMRDRPDRSAVLAKVDCPVMFIAGKEDTAVPIETNKAQFFLPKKSTIHILSDTAHMGMYEQETETLAMVENFVRQTAIDF